MLEREIASAMKFIIEKSGNPAPYYYNVPQDFLVPAVYFPQPEIISDGDTLNSYLLSYSWYIKFFHKDGQSAYELGFNALTGLQSGKNLIPLINESGEYVNEKFRTKDPSLKIIDDAAQLTIAWNSRRPYEKNYAAQKMASYDLNMYSKKAFENALKQNNKTED